MNTTQVLVKIFRSQQLTSSAVAKCIVNLIKDKKNIGTAAVLGLTIGASPDAYNKLACLHIEEDLRFHNVITFKLDVYYSMTLEVEQSYVSFMKRYLFYYIDTDHVRFLNGSITNTKVVKDFPRYKDEIQKCGGLNVFLGCTSVTGFNESRAQAQPETRLVELNEVTRHETARGFGGIANALTPDTDHCDRRGNNNRASSGNYIDELQRGKRGVYEKSFRLLRNDIRGSLHAGRQQTALSLFWIRMRSNINVNRINQ